MKNLRPFPFKYLTVTLLAMVVAICATIPAQAQERHTVRTGDTLFGIARSYDVSVNQIMQWNNLDSSSISVGQVLIVSEPEDTQSRSQRQEPGEVTTHTVDSGETLFRISRMYDISVADIRRWNDLSSDNLAVGQTLIVSEGAASGREARETTPQETEEAPATTRPSQTHHEVARGETLYGISRQYNMSVSELQRLNNLSSTNLSIGQRLLVNAQRPIASSDTPEPAETEEEADKPEPAGAFVKRTFGENETVEALLSRYQMDEEELINLNPAIAEGEIQPGDEIVVLTPTDRALRNPYRVSSNMESAGDIAVTVYDPQQKGSTTTSGDLYNPNHLTAAHSSIRLGKVVYIENPGNGKGIFVQINDRVTGNFLKLSEAAFNALGFDGEGELSAKIYEELPE